MEELLELVEDHQGGDEQRDVLGLRLETQVPAPPPLGAEPEDGPQKAGTAEAPEPVPAPAPAGSVGFPPDAEPQKQAAEAAALPGHPEEIFREKGPADSAGTAEIPLGFVSAKFRRTGPEEARSGANEAPLLRRTEAGNTEPPGLRGADVPDGTAADGETRSLPSARRGLEGLYRQTVQAARPGAQSPALPRQGQTVRLGEPETPRQLTVDELDRAVRRDSRRYDGGLEIF